MLRYHDIPAMKDFIRIKRDRIHELEQLAPTPERLAEVRKITQEAKDLQRTVRELRGNMYPYSA